MSLWKWSQTAASNGTIDSNVTIQEGQAPSTLNNGVRGVMAAVAKYRDDVSGNLVTAGTSTAYTLTTNQTLTTLTDGFKVTCRIDETNGAAATLNVDSLGAKALASVYGTALPEGVLQAGGIYSFTYDSTDDKWIVHGYFDALYGDTNPDLVAIEALAGTTGALKKTAANTWALDDGTTTLSIVHDGGGSVLSTGIIGDLHVPFACTITGAYAFADQSGSIVVDVWKDTYANYPPTDADSITASAPVTISTATKSADTTLTGWTLSVAAGDILRFNIDSVTTITRLTIALRVKRFI